MKIPFIGLICSILLFSGCGKNAFIIKKRYSKGIYMAHSGRIKTQHLTFHPFIHSTETTKEQISLPVAKSYLLIKSSSNTNSIVNTAHPIAQLHTGFQQHK